ncbi:MAG: DUF2312 domain-containing protein [Brevundimonas sp.]|nr:DUF2312 domain-containing protein [Brevundimonas sp.]
MDTAHHLPNDPDPDVLSATAQGRLRSIVERLERLEEDKQAVMLDMKEVFAEAKGDGYDVKILRKVLRLRKQDKAKRQEEEAILDLYLSALGEI